MNLLLDTHILLWSLLEPENLSEKVADALVSPDNTLWLSPVSTWEIMILSEKKRISLKPVPVDKWLRSIFQKIPFREATLNHEIAMQSRMLDLPHQDPVDRFLVASAIVYNLTLVTADRRLIGQQGFRIMANR